MSLTRTASGLQSLHRFYSVDTVVFCEGKRSATDETEYQSAEQKPQYDNTTDVYYWSKVVSSLELTKKFHFKSMGSKSALRKIAEDVAAKNISTITICVDSDYESIVGWEFNTSRTCRTYGYSWENDVLHEEIFIEIITDVIGIGPAQTMTLSEIRLALSRLRPALAKWTEIDVSLKKRARGCAFDRDQPTASLNFQRHPELREEALDQRLTALGYRTRPRKIAAISPHDVDRICFGKLWSKNLYHYGMKLYERFNIPKIPYELFMRQAIAATFRRIADIDGGNFLLFHRSQRQMFA